MDLGRAWFPLHRRSLLCLLAAALPGLGCSQNEAVTTGAPQRQTEFQVVADWPRLPAGYVLGQVAGVAVDSLGHVWIFHRATASFDNEEPIREPTVAELDPDTGELLSTWGAGLFVAPHGLAIDADDHLWLTDVGTDLVYKFDRAGNELLRLGQGGVR